MPTLRPVAVAFVVFGMFWGGWAVAAADVERALSLSHGRFGLLLSAGLAGAAATNAVGGALAERHGTPAALSASLGVWGGILVVAGLWSSSSAVLDVLVIGVIAMAGFVDVTMNVAATAGLADQPGKLVRFHALFNSGAAIGAALSGVILASGGSWRALWVGVGATGILLAAWIRGQPLPGAGAGEPAALGGALSLLRREHLAVVAVAFALGAMVEGGVELWGVLFLRTTLSSGLRVGASSAVAGYLVAAGARAIFGPAAGRGGAKRGVLYGGAAAAVGLVILVTGRSPVLAGFGLVLAAGGVSMCWPLLLAVATAGRDRPGAVVGAVSSIGYVGFVIGPSIIGGLAGAIGLRAALLVLIVAAAFVAVAPSLQQHE